MKVDVIKARHNERVEIKCPVCGKITTVTLKETKQEGTFECWNCGSTIHYDASKS